jgi:NADH:ubiquinone oxidoreductase subunit C
MTKEEQLAQVKEKLGAKASGYVVLSPKRTYVDVAPADIPEVSRILFKEMGARFQIASGIDTPGGFEILYHWAFDSAGLVLTVKTKLSRDNPHIESIGSFIKGAEWIEREMWELLGIQFDHHPDMRHLLLADDWPKGSFPLRRDFGKAG